MKWKNHLLKKLWKLLKKKQWNKISKKIVSNDLKEFGVDSDAPDLFSTETENSSSDDLLSSNNENEEDDLEIPAFLRRQKN
jgi:cell division protein FtsZ